MEIVHVIRHKVKIEGHSIRRVAREMKISRNTVKKYLKYSKPVFAKPVAKKSPVREIVVPRIVQLLESWCRMACVNSFF